MKKTLLFLFLLSFVLGTTIRAEAQTNQPPVGSLAPKGNARINGTVLDAATQQPISFATVTLADPATGKALDGALCDDKGKFSITNLGSGNYQVVVSFIGYETRTISNVRVSDRNAVVNLGEVKINSATQTLKEVTIEAQRALVEEKVDRTVYNAENDATNRGGDATDVLRKVPMLSVDLDGNVTMRGSQNIRVLINNRPSTIAASSIADALKQIPADMIKAVEVITSPSAKYDAEGSGGIINIVLKKNTLQGVSLNIDGGAGIRGSNLGLNGSYRKGKMGFSLGGFGRSNYNVHGNFVNSQQTQRQIDNAPVNILTEQSADTRNNGIFGRYQFGWDYDIDKNNFLSASVQYGLRNGHNFQDNLTTRQFNNTILARNSLQNVETTDNSGNVDVNLSFTRTFAKPQQEFSVLTQYSRNNRTNDFLYDTLNVNDERTITGRARNLNESANQEITIQADYQTPISKNQFFEIGAKDIIRQVSSDYTFYAARGAQEPFTPSPNARLSNVFDYRQNITAGYFSYTLTTPQMYSIKVGSRYEYTTINADFKNGSDIPIPSYGALVPSLNLSKKFKSGNLVKLAYNRRIQRPSLQFLNPNEQGANLINITRGNPDLEPEYTNNFEVAYNTYVKSTSLNFSAYARNTNNAIQSVRDTLGEGRILTTYQNIGQEDAYGFSFFTNVNLSGKLSLNGGTDVYYAVLDNNVPDPKLRASNKGWVANVRAFGNYNIGKGWGFQLFGFYRARQVQLQGYQGGFGIYSLSLRKDIQDKRGSIGFGAENFFTSSVKIRNEVISPLLVQKSTNELYNLNFKLTFSYRIGKLSMDNQPRRRRKSVDNDDLKGGGGDNQDGGGGAPAGGAPGQGQPRSGQAPAGGAPRSGTRPGQTAPAGGPGQVPESGQQRQGQAPVNNVPNQAPASPVSPDLIPADSTIKVPATPADSTNIPPVQQPSPGDSTGKSPVIKQPLAPNPTLEKAPVKKD
ncbi:MAG: TonB-dependent receptor [uncultured Adhaeribacter sp.]|uniref:TonB-dependent receptor n=1 Tax=uncultured Adhaeribacter sp. TaxID=448109 RepID=A0A6J4I047_9BACT|nr:MAG: TonB-dependent receptor [uncultured Adhaeribacter sp.]